MACVLSANPLGPKKFFNGKSDSRERNFLEFCVFTAPVYKTESFFAHLKYRSQS